MTSPTAPSVQPHEVAIVVFDGVQALDVFGPLDAFDAANGIVHGSYRLRLWSLEREIVRAENGVRIIADQVLDEHCRADTLILPGGAGARALAPSAHMQATLRRVTSNARRVAAVCTGAFLLAGLECGVTRMATHWKYADQLRERFPRLEVDADVLYMREDKWWSSAGVTAGIDLTLNLIADDLGAGPAIACARTLVVHYHRAGNQAQFSEPLQLQQRSAGAFGDLLAWMLAHPQADMSVEALAERAGMSARHLTRRFSATFGESPARYVERIRLDQARTLLLQGLRVEQVAAATGFKGADSFRRAFERRFSIAPSSYEQRFGGGKP